MRLPFLSAERPRRRRGRALDPADLLRRVERIADLIFQRLRGHEHAGNAEAALRGAVIEKRLLQRIESAAGRQSFDRLH